MNKYLSVLNLALLLITQAAGAPDEAMGRVSKFQE
jgi:hypothetical protein